MTTQERIMIAAAEVFSREGFRSATVRRICEKAGANVAAVNYYFTDKKGLYRAVVEEMFARGFEEYPADMGFDETSDPEERLRLFIRTFMKRHFHAAPHFSIWMREMAEPSPVLEQIVRKYIAPNYRILAAVISEILGVQAHPVLVERCAFSVVGQCIHYGAAAPILSKIAVSTISTEADIESVADHIYRFSLAGIRKVRDGQAVQHNIKGESSDASQSE